MKSLFKELSSLLRNSVISDERIELLPYRDIAFPNKKSNALAVVSPVEEKDVVELLKFCNEKALPVVPWGGGTNLCGALSPNVEHVILDLRRMKKIEVQPEKGFVLTQAGATIEEVQRAVEREGYFFAHDPWSRKSATVGGSLALDSAGTLYPKYGSIGDMLLSLKVVLPSGKVFKLGKELSKSSSSPPLANLFVGSEGMFGVILEAALKIYPKPEVFKAHGYGFQSFEQLFKAVLALCQRELLPDSFIGGTLPKRVTNHLPKKEKLLLKLGKINTGLYLCCCGKEEVVDSRLVQISKILRRYGRPLPQEYAEQWWKERHTYFETSPEIRKEELYPHVLDLTVPLDKVLEMKKWVEKLVAQKIGGDVISHTLFTAPDAYTVAFYLKRGECVDEIEKKIYEKVVEVGGTLTRTHGLGRLFSSKLIEKELGDGTLRILRQFKSMFDPNNILNPGVMNLFENDCAGGRSHEVPEN